MDGSFGASLPTAPESPRGGSGLLLRVSGFWFATLLCFAGCEDKNPTAKIGSPAEMGTQLNASLPKGTPIQSAKDFILKEGFSCEPRLDAKWKNKPHINYLHCKREDGMPPIKRLWEVAVIHDGTSVIVVDVRAALVYP